MNLIRYCVNQDIWFFALPESCSSSTAELPVEPKQIETGGFFFRRRVSGVDAFDG